MPDIATMQQVLTTDLAENLYPDNTAITVGVNDNQFISGEGKYARVVLPQSGAKPNVQIDREVIPAQVSKRKDTTISYDLRELTSDPAHISLKNQLFNNYNYRDSVLRDHTLQIRTKATELILATWAPTQSGRKIPTTGSATAATLQGASGNRKMITRNDLLEAIMLLEDEEVSMDGMIWLMPTRMHKQLFKMDEFIDNTKFANPDVKGGQIGMLFGIPIYTRSRVMRYDNSGAVKDWEQTAASSDNNAIMLFNRNYVRYAMGLEQVLYQEKNPTTYGDILSAMAYAGGSKRYEKEIGVVSIVEAATA